VGKDKFMRNLIEISSFVEEDSKELNEIPHKFVFRLCCAKPQENFAE
jgi:hypothetical protein